LFPGPIGDGRFATTWTPAPDLAAVDTTTGGGVATPFVWSALDCPSSLGIYADADGRPEGAFVLGRLAARVDESPAAGVEVVVVSWRTALEGRKLFAGSALQSLDGRVLAVARATWLRI
jgi:hypothetical protein